MNDVSDVVTLVDDDVRRVFVMNDDVNQVVNDVQSML